MGAKNKIQIKWKMSSNQTKDITCSVVNNFIHSTVSKIKYQLNNFLMDSAPKRATV